jgi:thiol-disulfide isomerase/thioredoxin
MPGTIELWAALALGAVFAVAAIAKLADLPGTRKAVVDFGIPRRVAAPTAVLLALTEIAVAIALVLAPTRGFGAAGALALIALLSAAVGVSLARGRRPDCHCFGSLHSAPAGAGTLARNAMLAALAALALVGDLAGESQAITLPVLAALVAVALAAGGGAGFLAVLRAHGRLVLRVDALESALADAGIELDLEPAPQTGLPVGTPAPAFSAPGAVGGTVGRDDLLAPGLPVLLAFTAPGCEPCATLLPALAGWQREHADRLTVAIVSGGDRAAARSESLDHDLTSVIVDDDLAIYQSYQAPGTPSAVLIAPDGKVASTVVAGPDAVGELVATAVGAGEPSGHDGLPVGAPVPEIALADLDGREVSLAGGEAQTLLLFWNPGCGFCSSMLDDMLAWERHRPPGGPRLVVVSSADARETRADGFSSQVVLDPRRAAATAFGAAGTPMAVLLGRDGTVASPLAAGAAAVLELAGPPAGDRKPITLRLGN